ncbi:helix-turn-helix domain-containing protein [Desulfobaculum sp. SPO524]|jgi:excisionase family DNA binding protein|uniref:helix-turn-helix domain-containing protein n=1 Tax=Desulfobaculum sp. SPO524 TaxID=3378071 RepID=UPI003854F9C5
MGKTLTVRQVAERLECRPEYVRGLIRRGELRASNLGTAERPRYRIRAISLEAFLDEREVVGIEED